MEKYLVKTITDKREISVSVPGSKSITNRALMLAAISDKVCKLNGVLFSADSRAFLDCLVKLGFQVSINEALKEVTIKGEDGKIPNKEATINVQSAGTAARFMTVLLAVAGGRYTLNSSEQMKKRPMQELLETLRAQGVKITCLENEGHFPFVIESDGIGNVETTIDTTTSSQYASALLMASVINGMKINLTGSRVRGAYILITLRMMEQFGIDVKKDENTYTISGQSFGVSEYDIEPDMSAACYFYGMAMILKTKAMVKGIHLDSMQGDKKFLDVLKLLGGNVIDTDEGVLIDCTNLSEHKGIEIDMSDFSDQALTMAVVAAFANGTTTIKNIGHIRGQESDRVQVIADELKKIGCKTEIVEGDTTDVVITPENLHNAQIETYDDHRVAMSFAMAGLKIEGIEIIDPMCCKKTFENYFNVLDELTK